MALAVVRPKLSFDRWVERDWFTQNYGQVRLRSRHVRKANRALRGATVTNPVVGTLDPALPPKNLDALALKDLKRLQCGLKRKDDFSFRDRASSPDKLTAHPELIVLALLLGHLTGCGQPWVSGCSPDAAVPYPGCCFNGQMGEEATDLRSPHLARVPMRLKAQKAPYSIDVLLFGAQAVMPDSQRLAQHIEQAWRGSPIWLCTFRHWQPQ